MPQGTLQIKLGAALNTTTARLHADLQEAADMANVARNAVARRWQRFHEDEDTDKFAEKPWGIPIYNSGRDAAPRLNSKIVSACKRGVEKWLRGKTPWNHRGEKYRWKAILSNEFSLPSHRSIFLPAPCQDFCIYYDGLASNAKATQRNLWMGEDSAVLSFPIYSQQAGRKEMRGLCRLEVRQMSHGEREILKKIVRKEYKAGDSSFVFKKGKWFFQLSYPVPTKDHNLDAERVAEIVPASPDGRRPFAFFFPGAEDKRWRWWMGDGLPLAEGFRRLEIRRKATRYRYRDGAAAKGRGKKQFYRALRPDSRAVQDMEDRFVKMMVADVIRSCVKNNCGKVIYRSPTTPVRDACWLSAKGAPFDWTRLESHLKWKLECNHIVFSKVGIKLSEWREVWGIEPPPKVKIAG